MNSKKEYRMSLNEYGQLVVQIREYTWNLLYWTQTGDWRDARVEDLPFLTSLLLNRVPATEEEPTIPDEVKESMGRLLKLAEIPRGELALESLPQVIEDSMTVAQWLNDNVKGDVL